MGNQRAFRALCENRQPGRQEHVLEYGEVSVHGAPFHAAVAGNRAGRKHAPVGERSRFQEPGEPARVPYDSFRSDLFLDIQIQIGPEHVLRVPIRQPGHQGDHAPPQGPRKRKIASHLAGEKRVAEALHGPACKQVHPPRPLELPRTGPRQHEPEGGTFFQQLVNDIQQFRNPLDFVDHEGPVLRSRRDPFLQALRVAQQLPTDIRGEQVQCPGLGKTLGEPSGLAGPAGTESVVVRGDLGEPWGPLSVGLSRWAWRTKYMRVSTNCMKPGRRSSGGSMPCSSGLQGPPTLNSGFCGNKGIGKQYRFAAAGLSTCGPDGKGNPLWADNGNVE